MKGKKVTEVIKACSKRNIKSQSEVSKMDEDSHVGELMFLQHLFVSRRTHATISPSLTPLTPALYQLV